jgi:hypothetical protein
VIFYTNVGSSFQDQVIRELVDGQGTAADSYDKVRKLGEEINIRLFYSFSVRYRSCAKSAWKTRKITLSSRVVTKSVEHA